MTDPEPQLLANGDIIVPATNPDGTRTTALVPVGHQHHAGWLAFVQGKDARPCKDGLLAAGLIAGLLLPILGVILGIVLLSKGRGAQGAAVLLTCLVGFALGLALLGY